MASPLADWIPTSIWWQQDRYVCYSCFKMQCTVVHYDPLTCLNHVQLTHTVSLSTRHLKQSTHVQSQPYLLEASAEPLEDSLHVPSLLHGDDPGVILLINPNQKCFVVVVPVQRGVSLTYTVLISTGYGDLSSAFAPRSSGQTLQHPGRGHLFWRSNQHEITELQSNDELTSASLFASLSPPLL